MNDAAIPRDAPENPYAVEDPPPWNPPPTRDERPPRGVYERGLAQCRKILAEHGAPIHGPHYTPRPER